MLLGCSVSLGLAVDDLVGGVKAGEVGVFESADVVVADEVEVGGLFAVEEGASDQVESGVPVAVFDDVPFGQVVGEPGLFLVGAEQD
jgi:hypothetical protein